MRHIGALLGITVLVFGTIFLFTSGWLYPPTEERAAVSQAAPPAAEQEVAQAEPAQEPAAEEAPTEPETPAEEPAEPAAPAATEGEAPAAEPAEGTETAAVSEELMTLGEEQYQICAACHGPEGEGSVGPAFAGNANLEDAAYVAETILFGREAMPPFGDQLDDEQVAAVGTFIRNSWGNEFGGIAAEDVTAAREAGPAE